MLAFWAFDPFLSKQKNVVQITFLYVSTTWREHPPTQSLLWTHCSNIFRGHNCILRKTTCGRNKTKKTGSRTSIHFHMCHGRSTSYIGDGKIPHLLGNPYNGYTELGWWPSPIIYGNGNHGSLDPSTYYRTSKWCLPKRNLLLQRFHHVHVSVIPHHPIADTSVLWNGPRAWRLCGRTGFLGMTRHSGSSLLCRRKRQ